LVAMLVSLFFGIHPMHVESVAWISELKDVLYTFFFMAGLISYTKYLERKPETFNFKREWIATLIFFILSLLSKPAAAVFPIILLLFDFYARRKSTMWLWLEKVPFFIFSIIFGLIAIKAQQADRLLHNEYTFLQRLFFASHSLLEYLIKLFIPANQSIFYPYPKIEGNLPFLYYLSPVVVILLFFAVFKTLKHSRLITFGFLFFLANIMLVLQLVSVGDAIMSDRYTYVSYIGLFFVAAMSIDKLYYGTSEKAGKYKSVIAIVVIVFSISCVCFTYARCKVWKNDDTIATDLLNKFPDDHLALNNKGFILFNQQRYQESINLFTKAVAIKPDYTRAYINLINSFLALNDYDNAMRTADTALKYVQDDYNLLNRKGNLLAMQRKCDEATEFYSQAIRLNRENIRSYVFLAECYYELKNYDKGLQIMEEALTYEPNNYLLLNNKGYFLFLKERYNDAVVYFKACLQRKPDYDVASVNLQNCYSAMKNSSK
jgi:tetratricopeptide (TPR) repeat protein